MCNIMWIYGIFVVTVLAATSETANAMEFEQFMSSLARSDNNDDKVDESPKPNEREIVQIMKRSGLIDESNAQNTRYNQELLAALQALQQQRNIPVYPADNAQPSTVVTTQARPARETSSTRLYSSYQKPAAKDSSSVQSQQATLAAALQQLNQQRSYSPLVSHSSGLSSTQQRSASPSQALPESTNSLHYSTNQQVSSSDNDKGTLKDDRQGHYAYDTYDGGYDGNILHNRNPGGYEAYDHQPQPHGLGLGLKLPVPQIAIKFDPLGLLKLLLRGIPRPLFNLNGRIFLGLELGKGVGVTKGTGGHYGGHSGGGKVITIG